MPWTGPQRPPRPLLAPPCRTRVVLRPRGRHNPPPAARCVEGATGRCGTRGLAFPAGRLPHAQRCFAMSATRTFMLCSRPRGRQWRPPPALGAPPALTPLPWTGTPTIAWATFTPLPTQPWRDLPCSWALDARIVTTLSGCRRRDRTRVSMLLGHMASSRSPHSAAIHVSPSGHRNAWLPGLAPFPSRPGSRATAGPRRRSSQPPLRLIPTLA